MDETILTDVARTFVKHYGPDASAIAAVAAAEAKARGLDAAVVEGWTRITDMIGLPARESRKSVVIEQEAKSLRLTEKECVTLAAFLHRLVDEARYPYAPALQTLRAVLQKLERPQV